MKTLFLSLLIVASALLFSSCHEETAESTLSEAENQTSETASSQTSQNTFEQITQEEAKRLMDSETNYVIIDARTEAEFKEGHIENAILIPEYEITQRAEAELPDKNGLILVYCRSGRRSKIAAEHLVNLGYTNVKEFGGIITWEYGTVK